MNPRTVRELIVATSVLLCMLMVYLLFTLDDWRWWFALSNLLVSIGMIFEFGSRLLVGRTDNDPE
jgi:hypothetical protein